MDVRVVYELYVNGVFVTDIWFCNYFLLGKYILALFWVSSLLRCCLRQVLIVLGLRYEVCLVLECCCEPSISDGYCIVRVFMYGVECCE